jgi:phytoene desaturase
VRTARRIVVVGGGLGGLAAAALLSRAGHRVTLLEANGWLGGKSRRILLGSQTVDTGPSFIALPGVWREFLRRWDALGSRGEAAEETAGLDLERLPEVGTYHFRGEAVPLPVPEGHPWGPAWRRFEELHGALGSELTTLLTTHPLERTAVPALKRLLRTYGPRLTTRSYLDGLSWLPAELREVLAIHTLNAGVSPGRTAALFASLPAVMSAEGIWVPRGGVNELPRALERLCRASGAEIVPGSPVRRVSEGKVQTEDRIYPADVVVSAVDEDRLARLLEPGAKPSHRRMSCSGVALYASLRRPLPEGTPPHTVVLPDDPADLYRSIEARTEPRQPMAFINYYRPGEVYPHNTKPTLALLLTAPADGREYGPESGFVRREVARVSGKLGLREPVTELLEEYAVLHPAYFGAWGSAGGALYGPARPAWMSGPFHRPPYSGRRRPWLWRVGTSVHPGGGIPAVLGGALISTGRLLERL